MRITINTHIIDVGYDRVTVMRSGNRIARCVILKCDKSMEFHKMLSKIEGITKLDNEMFTLMADHTHNTEH